MSEGVAAGRAVCTCGAGHAWRAAGHDDPPELAGSDAHAQAAAAPPFAGAGGRAVRRELAHATRWFAEPQQKDLIVLHYTEGGLPGWWGTCNVTWSSRAPAVAPKPVLGVGSTAFGVGRDGALVEYYPPACWSHHATGGTAVHRRSIGIELANLGWGFEVPRAGGGPLLRTRCASNVDPAGFVPVGALPADALEDLPRHFREVAWDGPRRITHWHAYPDAQVDALADLVGGLCDAFGIPRLLLPPHARLAELWPRGAGAGVARGIVCHANFVQRQPDCSEKWDLGPAFPWARFAARLGATTAPVGGQTVYLARPAAGMPLEARLVSEASCPAVRRLERQLTFLGFPCGRPDGVVDAETREGVRRFQRAEGLPDDGLITDALHARVAARYAERGGPAAERELQAAREAAALAARGPLSILEQRRARALLRD